MKKRYRVDFYDMFDGWISNYLKEANSDFETFDEAKIICDNKNSELPESNKKCGEHFSVIDLKIRQEIYCGLKREIREILSI